MSDDGFDVDRLAVLVEAVREKVTGIKQAIVDGEEDSAVLELADDLWTVLDELEDVLDTIQLDELPEAIEVDELPDSVDIEDVPEGLFDEDQTAIDLSDVHEAVNLRELWDAVHLAEFLEEKRELDQATDDVGDHLDEDEGDDEDELFENVVGTGEDATDRMGAEVGQIAIEETIEKAVREFREALLVTHDGLRKLYEANQRKLGRPGNQPNSLNPSAYSTLPRGPVPASASTRTSTVPARVKYSRIESQPRRIYGRRFEQERRRAKAETDEDREADPDDEEVPTTRE